MTVVCGSSDYLKVALAARPQFRILDHLKKKSNKNRVKPGKPSFLLLLLLLRMFLFAVPPGNSERIVEDGVRRSHAGKSKAKNDLSCQRGI